MGHMVLVKVYTSKCSVVSPLTFDIHGTVVQFFQHLFLIVANSNELQLEQSFCLAQSVQLAPNYVAI